MISLLRRLFNPDQAACAEARKLASDYLADDLPARKRSGVQDHISRCGPCRAFVDTLAATIGLLTQMPKVTSPASLKQAILERTRKGDQSGSD